MTGSSLV